MSRGDRLHQEQRKKDKVRRILRDVYQDRLRIMDSRVVGVMAHSPAICSCQMCRNPRHSSLGKGKDKLTIQERRQSA